MTHVHPGDFLFGLSVGILLAGCISAASSGNPLKRAAAVGLALVGAMGALAALRAAPAAILAGAGVAFGFVALGVAIAVRLHEAYGAGDTASFDNADQAEDLRR